MHDDNHGKLNKGRTIIVAEAIYKQVASTAIHIVALLWQWLIHYHICTCLQKILSYMEILKTRTVDNALQKQRQKHKQIK